MSWLVRTKSGLELACQHLSLSPDRSGFVKLVHVYRLIYPPGHTAPVVTSLVKHKGLTEDAYLALSAIELYTEKVDLDLERKQLGEKRADGETPQ